MYPSLYEQEQDRTTEGSAILFLSVAEVNVNVALSERN